jgi:hypothetical protein
MDAEAMEVREWLVENRVQEAVSKVYALVWADDMSAAESRLAWMQVIAKLVESVTIDRRIEVTSQWLGFDAK